MEYKRLTKRNNGLGAIPLCDACSRKGTERCIVEETNGFCCIEEQRNRLADLEDKIEQGTLIELPCKVGDTAYSVNYVDKGWRILKGYVNEINIDVNGIYIRCGYEYLLSFWHKPILGDVFFNIEDAEKRLKALKELQNG